MAINSKTKKPQLTIVGGQPLDNNEIPGAGEVEVPVGFEMLLYQAAQDEPLKSKLLTDRQAAIAESKVPLRPSEKLTLEAISNEALETMIGRLGVDNPRGRRSAGY